MFKYLLNLSLKFNFCIFWFIFFFNITVFNYFFFNIWIIIFFWLLIFFNFKNNFSLNNYYLHLNYFLHIILNKFFFFWILNNLTLLVYYFKSASSTLNIFRHFSYKWNPLIKQYSYYGYFKSNISHWNYSKTDEIKKYKF